MKTLIIDNRFQDCRLDRFLKESFNLTQGLICKYLRKKVIRLNGGKAEIDSRVSFGDEIQYFDFAKLDPALKAELEIRDKDLKLILDNIIFENEEIIAINKPYGISVQKGSFDDISIIDILHKLKGEDIKIVHRLDKNTTGVMIFAKNKNFASKYSEYFKNQEVQKTYIAILEGIVKKESGEIESTIEKLSEEGNQSLAAQDTQNGKIAISEFKTLSINHEKKLSLVKFFPKTGRIHQIRLHALKLGFGVFGDDKYNKNYQRGQKLCLTSVSIKLPNLEEITAQYIPDHFKNLGFDEKI